MTENQESKTLFKKPDNEPYKYGSEEERIRALAGADVPRYPDGRPVLFLNALTPVSFDEYKRICKVQRRMSRLKNTHMMQWPKRTKSDKRFVFGKAGGE